MEIILLYLETHTHYCDINHRKAINVVSQCYTMLASVTHAELVRSLPVFVDL